ncbi:MAG: phosphoribosylaminoimidazolesuccinocarboxamide synthase [Alphaproteobacteria bacterium]|nr:phosphoribosylaminoimidazolesuccinocarboxamide synthase [Alphaproteobacteria bacterium]
MARRKKLYDGKAKTLYEGPESGTIIQYFKDDATAGNGKKHDIIPGKGVLNNRISSHLMTRLESIGIPTHFIRSINMREQLVHSVEIIPLEVVVRNIAAGSLCERLGLEEGEILSKPLVEFYYKKDELNDPLVSEDHVITMGWADPYELEEMVAMAWRVNDYLCGLFAGIGIKLVDFKLEFGRIWGAQGELYIVLADEISPDNCRLWDAKTNEKMDKDRFRHDLGDLIEGYEVIAKKLGLIPEDSAVRKGGNFNEELFEKLGQIENELVEKRRLRSLKASAKPKKF